MIWNMNKKNNRLNKNLTKNNNRKKKRTSVNRIF